MSQCKLVFRARPHDFDDDEVKITYAVSWLKGTAQRWYEPNLALAEDDLPIYALIWDEFEEAMKTTFREPDPIASASYKLDHLAMKDSYHITKYNVDLSEPCPAWRDGREVGGNAGRWAERPGIWRSTSC
jgi:hypothetical protein